MIILLVLVLILSGCKGEGEGTEASESPSTTEAVTAAAALSDISGYKIIYSISASKTLISEIKGTVSALESAYGVKLPYDSDLELSGASEVDSDTLEILVGETNRVESKAAKKELPTQFSYTVRVSESKIVILGGNAEMTLRALSAFCDTVISNGSLAIEENYLSVVDLTDEIVDPDSLIRKIASEYTVIFPASSKMGESSLAKKFASELGENAGCDVKTAGDRVDESEKEILVGITSRAESAKHAEGVAFYDYKIAVDGNKIAVNAGSEASLKWGLDALLAMIKEESLDIGKDSESHVKFGEDTFNPIVYDLSLFTPSWSASYTPPAWMLDFSEKTYAVTCGRDSRITFKAHRGDKANYPENSIEGLASAILAGVDSVEVDVYLTADGVAVLMHDETLTRTTNVNEFLAKEGYPSSLKVGDWTYAQLQALSLKDTAHKQTEYKIPTLYEALLLCRGRIFIQVDDKSGTLKTDTDLYRMAADTDSKEIFFHYYGLSAMEKWVTFDPNDTEFAEYVKICRSYLSQSGHSLRKVYWPNDTNTYAGGLRENAEWWQKLTSQGRMMIWTENVTEISKYVSANYNKSN